MTSDNVTAYYEFLCSKDGRKYCFHKTYASSSVKACDATKSTCEGSCKSGMKALKEVGCCAGTYAFASYTPYATVASQCSVKLTSPCEPQHRYLHVLLLVTAWDLVW
ncbi:hypothetical protein GUITHDRAFT_114388 [Guillardia theta CCMP2712]|uniref:Uncharacterized protein n=1 Tax=Guillardia theta (strain CCMP2712) TaxID=905079 RepID=L1IU55_GUITC|nr:hypothetical protein GUITHDRAFT_114388 [Guillardia theta CCMP2712]EKX39429.1 hypothetical protein GUITHDRAFT_114388 [Guillardia theta CCMP2712]|eukprot:XP_005826409.1 hypothetical protein GUITHDRAFT_114388 [Guillardia theta CCMP2712]